MASYGYQQPNIAPFATEWFNRWKIGTENSNGKNQGILLLISVGDRKARIALGADWGRNFDDHCQVIMDDVMIPYFKKGDYSSGIAAGVDALLRMTSRFDRLPKPQSSAAISFSIVSNGSGFTKPTYTNTHSEHARMGQ